MLALGAKPGEAYEGLDWGEAWPFQSESMTAYREQRYDDAFDAVRRGLEQVPDHPGLHYNYACFATLAGETGDETFEPPPAVGRALPALPGAGARGRGPHRRARRPAVRGGATLTAPVGQACRRTIVASIVATCTRSASSSA